MHNGDRKTKQHMRLLKWDNFIKCILAIQYRQEPKYYYDNGLIIQIIQIKADSMELNAFTSSLTQISHTQKGTFDIAPTVPLDGEVAALKCHHQYSK